MGERSSLVSVFRLTSRTVGRLKKKKKKKKIKKMARSLFCRFPYLLLMSSSSEAGILCG